MDEGLEAKDDEDGMAFADDAATGDEKDGTSSEEEEEDIIKRVSGAVLFRGVFVTQTKLSCARL